MLAITSFSMQPILSLGSITATGSPRRSPPRSGRIVGLHLHPWDFIYNPILDTDYTGGLGNLQYNPSGRVAYNFNDRWAIAAEEYDGFGPLRGFLQLSKQFHEVWATTDYSGSKFLGLNIESGVGYGLTGGSDKWTLKLMLSRNLNVHPWHPE